MQTLPAPKFPDENDNKDHQANEIASLIAPQACNSQKAEIIDAAINYLNDRQAKANAHGKSLQQFDNEDLHERNSAIRTRYEKLNSGYEPENRSEHLSSSGDKAFDAWMDGVLYGERD